MATCEACGSVADLRSGGIWGNSGTAGKDNSDVAGAIICWPCHDIMGPEKWDALYDRIRARRASSPQPEAGPVVLSAEGRPIKVGERVMIDDGKSWSGIVESTQGDHMREVTVRRDADHEWAKESPLWYSPGNLIRHAPSPAKPPGGEVELVKEPRPGQYRATWPATYVGIDWAIDKTPGVSAEASGTPLANVRTPPGPSLAAFEHSVQQHLVPLLPKSLRCVTDSVTQYGVPGWMVWLLHDNGSSFLDGEEPLRWGFEVGELLEAKPARLMADAVARLLLADLARKSKDGK